MQNRSQAWSRDVHVASVIGGRSRATTSCLYVLHCSSTQCPEHAPWRHSSSHCSSCVSTRLTSVYPARHSSIAMTSTSFSCTGKRAVIQLRLTPLFQENVRIVQNNIFCASSARSSGFTANISIVTSGTEARESSRA